MEASPHLSNELTSLDQLGDFHVVGFDADFTIVKYNVRELAKMIVRGKYLQLFSIHRHISSAIMASLLT